MSLGWTTWVGRGPHTIAALDWCFGASVLWCQEHWKRRTEKKGDKNVPNGPAVRRLTTAARSQPRGFIQRGQWRSRKSGGWIRRRLQGLEVRRRGARDRTSPQTGAARGGVCAGCRRRGRRFPSVGLTSLDTSRYVLTSRSPKWPYPIHKKRVQQRWQLLASDFT